MLPLLFLAACTKFVDEDTSFLNSATAPADLGSLFHISNDNSGNVTITPVGAGVATFEVDFGDNSQKATVQAGKSVSHVYGEGSYTVTLTGKGSTGLASKNEVPLEVVFRDPENVAVNASTDAHTITVSATADFATAGFLVFFGEQQNEVGKEMAAGSFLTHTYSKAGTYDVKVVALSGGAAKTEVVKQVRIFDPLTLPMTFENPNVSYAWGDFGGSMTSVIDNPLKAGINTSNKVTKIVKGPAETWAGNYIILTEPLNLTQKKVFKVKTLSSRAGMRVLLQLERNGDNSFQDNREVSTTKANKWEVLTFDFTGVDNVKRLQNILFFIDNGVAGNGSQNFTLYVDDIELQ